MKRFLSHFLVTLSIVSPLAWSQTQPAAPATRRVVVHAGKLLDVKSGKTLTDQAIVIEDGKIVSLGSASAAAGATTIDLPNATVLPGLIDAHTHITFNPQ